MTNRTGDVWSYESIEHLKLDPEWPAVEIGVHRDGTNTRVVLAQDPGPHYLVEVAAVSQLIAHLELAADRAEEATTA
jgi:hypothetical protein